MSKFTVMIQAVVTNGPYCYVILKDGVGQKSADNVANVAAALDGVKADIAGLLNGETVSRIGMDVTSG